MTTTDDRSEPTRWSKATQHPGTWANPDDDPRESGAETETNDERSVLVDYLHRYRLTLEMKCADLDPEQLARRSVSPSTMSLLGLVRHMAEVERHWFRREMAQVEAPRLYWTKERPDDDFDGAVPEQEVVDDAWRSWRAEVAFAEQYVEDTSDLGTRGRTGGTLRGIVVHMIEEYA
ncbi:MAG: DinB family protein, partial [Nocardioidaceae bacterium]